MLLPMVGKGTTSRSNGHGGTELLMYVALCERHLKAPDHRNKSWTLVLCVNSTEQSVRSYDNKMTAAYLKLDGKW